MNHEPTDERIQLAPECHTVDRTSFPSAARTVPDLRAPDDHTEEIRFMMSAAGRGGAICGGLFGFVAGATSGSLIGFILGIVVGALGGAVLTGLGLLIFLMMFFVCERVMLWYMAATAERYPTPIPEGSRREDDDHDASDTAFQQRPSRR
jgi:hypothetical protein